MAQEHDTPELALLEEAITILFCLIDDDYRNLNPKGRHYATLKQLTDSEVITLALYSSNSEAWSPNAPFCARPPAFSLTSSRARSGFIPPRSIAAFANSGASLALRRGIAPQLVGGP